MNDRKQLHELIHQLCKKLEQTNHLLQFEGEVSMLDIDLLRKTSIDIYDAINQLRLVKHQAPQASGASTVQTIIETPIKRLEQKEEDEILSSSVITNELVQEKEMPSIENAEEKQVSEIENHTELNQEEPKTNDVETSNTEIETIESTRIEARERKGLVEMPVFELPSDLASRFQGTPIIDLKKAISIAKKFEYINSLFNKDATKYDQVIHSINHSNNIEEAWKIFATSKQTYGWDDEDKNYLELADLIRRRFL